MNLDHRDLNRDLAIFATDPLAGSGLPLWLPDGAVVFAELERLAADLARADGCVPVKTPVLGKRALFERSGHWAKFADDMFPPMDMGSGPAGESGDELVLRPANCPHHALVYKARQHSYRELPLRLHELAPMFRAERSGVLSGLSRVRQINLDDTHVFCRPDQVADEAGKALRSALKAQEILGLRVDYVRLSLRDDSPSYLGSAAQWRGAEEALRKAASDAGVEVVEALGEAAFYGPKLDLQVVGRSGHEETIATVQVDFNQPERFDLTYDAADGSRERVVMVHRGTVGSMERVTAALLERYQGRLPLWLAPHQLAVLPVSPSQDEAARELVDALVAEGLRPRLDSIGSLGARIRESRRRREPLIAIVGSAEAEDGQVQVRDVAAGVERRLQVEDLVAAMKAAYAVRAAALDWPS
ncbi:threonine--tRNA ligase [Nocardioides albus]|uniref:Threonine--tRNA ligase n=1 Tax=Nocardioides albus TaxID=1841 RepID=A0A7W5A8Y4_9ACTN|nr:threonine--tRNA ligase [Nocardioides albus]MBB3091892.1 threonyl-tRNA synthetase [Nocardioides albus]GGU32988.1 threonine--tRNA ligase [Nocardioides albus]